MPKKELKKQTLYVTGMHCDSCELLIEKYAQNQYGITHANASLKDGRLDILYNRGKGIDIEDLNHEFREAGYLFSTKNLKKGNIPAIYIKHGSLFIDKEKFVHNIKLLSFTILFLAIFAITDRLQLYQYINIQETYSIGAIFLLGIIAGISSCAALVGGILLSLTQRWNTASAKQTEKERRSPHFLFHIGRLITYAVLGGFLGLIGKTFTFRNTTIGAVFVLAVSIIMLISALKILNINWAQRITIPFSKSLSRSITNKKGGKHENRYLPMILGGATFFLPCGFTLIAQSLALTTGNFWQSSLIMLAFALGTLPTLLGISFSGIKANRQKKNSQLFSQVAGILILFFAGYNINAQLNVLGLPSLNDIGTIPSTELSAPLNQENTTQELKIVAKGFKYIISGSSTLQNGIETNLIIDNQGVQGCANYIVGRGLFDGYIQLKPGINTLTFTPQTGTYKITCSMGMVPPVTIVVK